MRILYVAGPGDVVGTFRAWCEGQADFHEVAETYSGQFFSTCERLNLTAAIISRNARKDAARGRGITVKNCARWLEGWGGLAYHIAQVAYGLRILAWALRYRADLALVSEGSTYWFVLSLLHLFGVKTAASVHCVLWPEASRPGAVGRLINWLNGTLFFRRCFAIITVSARISDQIRTISRGHSAPIIEYLPLYKGTIFDNLAPPTVNASMYRFLFAGRVEANKGVFDLLEAARRLRDMGRTNIVFDVCGSGSALPELKDAARDAGLQDTFLCHGHTRQPEMLARFAEAYAVVNPTRPDFVEGFNKVAIEAVLAGRPSVTTRVCPATDYLASAMIVVDSGPEELVKAIVSLVDDKALYQQLKSESQRFRGCFNDPGRSWGAALSSIVLAATENRVPAAISRLPLPA